MSFVTIPTIRSTERRNFPLSTMMVVAIPRKKYQSVDTVDIVSQLNYRAREERFISIFVYIYMLLY